MSYDIQLFLSCDNISVYQPITVFVRCACEHYAFLDCPLMSEPSALHPLWLFIPLIPAHFFITTALIMLTMQKQQMKFLSQIVSLLNTAPQLADRTGQEDALSAEKPADNEPNLLELAAGESMQETHPHCPRLKTAGKISCLNYQRYSAIMKQRLNPKRPKAHFFHSGRIRRGKKMLMGSGSQKKTSSFSILSLFTKAKWAIITIVIFYFLIQLLSALNLVKNLFN